MERAPVTRLVSLIKKGRTETAPAPPDAQYYNTLAAAQDFKPAEGTTSYGEKHNKPVNIE
jgi:hypothetical protein